MFAYTTLLRVVFVLPYFLLAGCPIDGDAGKQGVAGVNCWDVNQDGVNDSNEDTNGDGRWNVNDCVSISQVVPQNSQAEYSFQHFCEAFAALGQYPQGCPTVTHSTPVGTLTLMSEGQFDSSGETCSDLSVVTVDDKAYWSLNNAFIAETQIISTLEIENCPDICDSDSRCIASYWQLINNTQGGVCYKFYHSDGITKPYQHICGIDIPDPGGLTIAAAEACLYSIGITSRWDAICP